MAQSPPVTLSLKNADIGALISTVSEVTGKNFIVDPRVQGKVTVISGRELGRDELYQVFLSVLRVHGYATVGAGEVVKIVPEDSARVQGEAVNGDGSRARGDAFVTRVIAVQHVQADQLVPVLRPLVPQHGHLAAYAKSNTLIVSDRAANVERLAEIVRRVDVPGPEGIEVIALEHASAGEVVRILQALSPAETTAAVPTRFVADERTNSVLVSSDAGAGLRLRALITHLDTPHDAGGNTRVAYLKHARAAALVPILEGMSGKLGTEPESQAGSSEASIQADEAMNALVITASPTALRSLLAVVRQLDVPRAQVLVEAVIADIATDTARELGVQWRATNPPQDAGVFGGTSFSGGGLGALAGNPLALGSGLSLGISDGTFSFRGQEFLNIGLLIRALSADQTTNILSTPSLVTLDNEEAEIVIAQNVPFLTGQFTNTGTASAVNPFQTIVRQDVGIILRVRPQVNEGNRIKLDIEQEVSSVAPASSAGPAGSGLGASGAVDLVTNKRSIRTTVTVEDGRVIVLGGLINDDLKQSREKVPVLGDIPLIGRLFSFDSATKTERSLVVFLRPLILLGEREELVSSGKYSYLRAQQLRQREAGALLMPSEAVPALKPLPAYRDSTRGETAHDRPRWELDAPVQ